MDRPARLDLIELLALPLAACVLTATSLSLWAAWLLSLPDVPRRGSAPSLLVTSLFMAVVAYFARAVLHRDWPLPRVRRVVLVGVGVALLALQAWVFPARFPFGYLRDLLNWGRFISPELMILSLSAFLAWRGVMIGRAQIAHAELESSFYNGVVSLAVLFALNRAVPVLSLEGVARPTVLFFATGLGALALSSFERSRRQQEAATGTWLTLNRDWLATVGGVIGLILLLGLMLVALLSPEVLASGRRLIQPLEDWLVPYVTALVGLIALGLGYLLAPLFDFLINFLRQFMRGFQPPQFPQLFSPDEGEGAAEALQRLINSPVVQTTGHGLTTLLIVALFALLAALALRRLIGLTHSTVDETRESVFSRELLLRQLRDLLRRPRPAAPAVPPPPYLALEGPADDPRLMVRRAYQVMLEWARGRQLPRPPGQTPDRYAQALGEQAPEARGSLETLTAAYRQARYADQAPSPDEARAARAAADRLPPPPEQEKRR